MQDHSSLSDLARPHVEWMFEQMETIFQSRWKHPRSFAAWLNVLQVSGVTLAMLQSTVKAMLYGQIRREWPPTPAEMADLCLGVDEDEIEWQARKFMPCSFDRQRMSARDVLAAEGAAREKAVKEIRKILADDPHQIRREQASEERNRVLGHEEAASLPAPPPDDPNYDPTMSREQAIEKLMELTDGGNGPFGSVVRNAIRQSQVDQDSEIEG